MRGFRTPCFFFCPVNIKKGGVMKVISIFKKHPFDEFCDDLVHPIENNTGKRPTDKVIERCRKVYDSPSAATATLI